MFVRTLASQSPVQGPGPNSAYAVADAPASFLGPGVGIQGVLEIDGELVVSGPVKGRIAALKLVIGPTGFVEGDVIAREVIISGRLNGRVFAPNVSIEASAEV